MTNRDRWAPDVLVRDPIFRLAQLLVLFKVAVVWFVFYPPALDTFALAKSAISHITAFALVALLAWLFVRYGRAIVGISALHLAVVGVVATFALASVFSLDGTVALFGTSRRYLGLTQIIDDSALFLAIAILFTAKRDRAWLAAGLLIAAVPLILYAFVQRLGYDIVTYVDGPASRPIASLGQPDTAGAFYGIVAATALSCAVLPWSNLSTRTRIAAASVGVLAALAGVFTGSRGSLLAMGAGIVALSAILVAGRYRRPKSLGSAALLVVACGLVVTPLLAAALLRVVPSSGASIESRIEIWQTAARIIASRPIVGVGPDNFAVAYPAFHDIRSVALTGEFQNSTHNFLLYAATSAGILGLLAVSLLVVMTTALALRAACRRDPTALLFVLMAAYVGQGAVTISDLSLEWVPFGAAGLVAAASTAGLPSVVRRPANGVVSSAIVGATVLLLAAWLSQGELSRITASEAQGSAQYLRNLGKPLAALDYARAALRADGSRAEYWVTFGEILSDVGNPSAAGNAFQEAVHRQPWNPIYWRDLAITYLARGDEPRALQSLANAVSADPFDVSSHDLLARIAYNKAEWQRAFDEGELAVRILPSNPELYDAPVRAALRLSRIQAAEDLLNTGIKQHETAHLRVLLATVYATSGRASEAIKQVDRALVLAPGDPEALQLRIEIGNQR